MKTRSICHYNQTQIYQKIRQLLPVLPPIERTLHLWSVDRRILRGKQEGVEILTLNNGNCRFKSFPPGHGYFGCSNGRYSPRLELPVKEVVDPTLILRAVVDSDGSKALTSGWSGAGLNLPVPAPISLLTIRETLPLDLTLHGKIQNIPASSTRLLWIENHPTEFAFGAPSMRAFYLQAQTCTEVSTIPGSESRFR